MDKDFNKLMILIEQHLFYFCTNGIVFLYRIRIKNMGNMLNLRYLAEGAHSGKNDLSRQRQGRL